MHVVRWTLALAACSSEPGGSDLPTDAGPRPLGTLEVITVPAGPGTDPDGYRLELNGVVFGAMTSADTLLVGNLPEAEYAVGLAGVAAHCDNGGANPRSGRPHHPSDLSGEVWTGRPVRFRRSTQVLNCCISAVRRVAP